MAQDSARVTGKSGLTIVYFANDWAAENRTSSHHIAERLSRWQPLLYVSSPGMRAPKASGRDFRKIGRLLAALWRPPVRVREGLWCCTIPQLPFRRIPGVVALNGWFARQAVRRALAQLQARELLLWFTVPHPQFLVGRLGERMVVYYCIDDYAAHPGVDSVLLRASDLALTRKADRVFVAPPALLAAKRLVNESTLFSPHGVDAELFGRALLAETQIPAEARALQPPVIGFFGSLAAWIDVPLLAQLARARPQYTLLLIGHVSTDVSELQGLANVRLVGAQPYETLPNWAKSFNVAIIPYRQNQQVQNANPLKLREYLATGKPVVSTFNPEVARFGTLVRLATDVESFIQAVDAAVAERDPAAQQARLAAVKNATWDARVQEVIAVVSADLQRPASPTRRYLMV